MLPSTKYFAALVRTQVSQYGRPFGFTHEIKMVGVFASINYDGPVGVVISNGRWHLKPRRQLRIQLYSRIVFQSFGKRALDSFGFNNNAFINVGAPRNPVGGALDDIRLESVDQAIKLALLIPTAVALILDC